MSRNGAPVAEFDEVHPADHWPEICRQMEHVVLAVPLTERTRNMVDAKSLNLLRPHAVVVNVGRGASVNSDALLDALETEQIGAACLDVTWPEPLPEGHGLWRHPRALITSHTANPRAERVALLAAHVEDNLRRWFDGNEPLRVIDVARGY
jgi:D-3-phosphoglycerate dehydrogenase